MNPLRIALVDDHAVVRAGYRRLLELEGMTVVAEFADAESAYAGLTREAGAQPDLLILDLSLPGASGLDLLRRIRARRPGLPVLIFSMHDRAAHVRQCLREGAAGYVSKSSAPEDLVAAVFAVLRGERVLSPDVADFAMDGGPGREPALSAREFDVLQALLAGLGLDEIAERLHLSPKTVSNYQTQIRQKLGVSNASELLRYAQEHGLI